MLLSLYINTAANQLITSLSNPAVASPAALPFFVGDTIALQVYLLTPLQVSNPSTFPFSNVSTAGLNLELFLDQGEYDSGIIYTQQVNWLTDPNNQYFYATLALNTAALQTLIGTNTSATCFLHIGFTSAQGDTTVLLQPITVQAGIPNNAVAVPAGLTPLSLEAAKGIFVQVVGPAGAGIILTSPDGKEIMLRAVDNGDGTASFHADPIN